MNWRKWATSMLAAVMVAALLFAVSQNANALAPAASISHQPMYGPHAYQLLVQCVDEEAEPVVDMYMWGVNGDTATDAAYELSLVIAMWRGVLSAEEFVAAIVKINPEWADAADGMTVCFQDGGVEA